MKVALALGLVVGLALVATAAAPSAGGARVGGVVVGKDRAQHALVVADAAGMTRTVRVGGAYRMPIGARVLLQAKRLTDGTFRAANARLLGKARTASIRGVVLRFMGRGFLLGAGKSVLLVRRAKLGRTLQARADEARAGARVVVKVAIAKSGGLSQQSLQATSAGSTGASVDVVGALTELAPNDGSKGTPGSITVQVDSAGGPVSFTCTVPSDFPDLSAFLPLPAAGQPAKLVEMECDLVDGAWTLRSLSSTNGSGAKTDAVQADVSSDGDEVEVHGEVTALTPATTSADGSITVDPDGSGSAPPVTCVLPAGFDTLGVQVGDIVELECEDGVVQELELEDDVDDDSQENAQTDQAAGEDEDEAAEEDDD